MPPVSLRTIPRRLGAFLAVVLLGGPAVVAQDVPGALVERTALGGKVTVLVPESFRPMTAEMIRLKYPGERPPTLVFSNGAGTVNLAVNLTADRIRPDQIPELHAAMVAMFKRAYPSATWHRSGVFDRDGRRYFALDLVTPAVDTPVRNVMAGTSYDGRLLLVSFNVTQALEPAWIEAGQRMVESLKVRE